MVVLLRIRTSLTLLVFLSKQLFGVIFSSAPLPAAMWPFWSINSEKPQVVTIFYTIYDASGVRTSFSTRCLMWSADLRRSQSSCGSSRLYTWEKRKTILLVCYCTLFFTICQFTFKQLSDIICCSVPRPTFLYSPLAKYIPNSTRFLFFVNSTTFEIFHSCITFH